MPSSVSSPIYPAVAHLVAAAEDYRVSGRELLTALEPRERIALGAVPEAERAAAFAQCWVRKEAYLKGTGEGLSREPDAVRVGLGTRFGDPGPAAGELDGWQIADLDAPPGYAGAIALLSLDPPIPGADPG